MTLSRGSISKVNYFKEFQYFTLTWNHLCNEIKTILAAKITLFHFRRTWFHVKIKQQNF